MYDFTTQDLKLNKRGQLSPSQKEWLKTVARGVRGSSRSSAYIAIGFMFPGLVIVPALFLQSEDSRAALF